MEYKGNIAEPVETYNQTNLAFTNYTKQKKLDLLVKWAGGKEKELKFIIPNLPKYFENYYEPFVGGGSVYTAIQSNKAFINDKSTELISLYKIIKSNSRDNFFNALSEITHNWNILGEVTKNNKSFFIELYKNYSENYIEITELQDKLYEFILKHSDEFNGMFSTLFNFNIENFLNEIKKNLVRKIKRMKVLEQQKHKLPDNDILDNIETALKSAFYMHFRHLYNNTDKYKLNRHFSTAIFLFIRNYAYSGMFRYNSKGEFNVPYGGIGYNNKNFRKKIEYLKSDALQNHLSNTVIESMDFEAFLEKHKPTENDFIFLDPPYDTEFSTYAQNEFNRKDQERLANYLIKKTKAKWMLIIKNTDFICNLYSNNNLNIQSFDKTYLVSFMNRNNKKTEHLLIKNY
jgi:DNA adenine methylase